MKRVGIMPTLFLWIPLVSMRRSYYLIISFKIMLFVLVNGGTRTGISILVDFFNVDL